MINFSANEKESFINFKLKLYHHNIKSIPNPSSNFFVTLKGFYADENLFSNPAEVATLLVLSTFNTIDSNMNNPLTAKMVSPRMIFDRFNFKTVRGKKELIIETLNNLASKEIITIVNHSEKVKKLTTHDFDTFFDFRQGLVWENDKPAKRFYSVRWDEFTTVLENSTGKLDSYKINLLATLASIVSCFKADKANFDLLNELKSQAGLVGCLCIRGEQSLAKRIGLSRKTINPLIEDLRKIGLIAFEKVNRSKDKYKWQRYYVRSEHYDHLLWFIFDNLKYPFGQYVEGATQEQVKAYKALTMFNINALLIRNINFYRVDGKFRLFLVHNNQEIGFSRVGEFGEVKPITKPKKLEIPYLSFDDKGGFTYQKQARYDAELNLIPPKERKKSPSDTLEVETGIKMITDLDLDLDLVAYPDQEEFQELIP